MLFEVGERGLRPRRAGSGMAQVKRGPRAKVETSDDASHDDSVSCRCMDGLHFMGACRSKSDTVGYDGPGQDPIPLLGAILIA